MCAAAGEKKEALLADQESLPFPSDAAALQHLSTCAATVRQQHIKERQAWLR